MAKPTAVLYMGTFNKPKFMNNAKNILIKNGFKVKLVRWNTGAKNSIAYTDIDKWNVQRGFFDVGVSHSAGGFPLQKTNALVSIAINPFISVYPLVNFVMHATKDKLVPFEVNIEALQPKNRIITYKGGHSTFPKDEFRELIQ